MKYQVLAALLSVCAISAAHAQSAGQVMINAGWLHLAPQDSSQPLTVNALGQSSTVPGSGASLEGVDTLALTARYYVTDHIAVETLLGIPPKLRLNGSGTLAPVGELGTARPYSPSIIAQYHFGAPEARFRPYVGAGVAYVWYQDIELSSPVATGQLLYSPTFGTHLEGPTSASLSKSLAPVANAGLTYNIDKHWSIGASLSYMWLTTKADLTTQSSLGTVHTTTKLKIDPIVSFVSVGYQF